MTVCLFLPTGRTYTFRNASITVDNETVLVVSYRAMSDGLVKTGTFQKNQIVGWAVSDDSPAGIDHLTRAAKKP